MKEIRYETLRYTASSRLLLGTLGAEHNRELRENRDLRTPRTFALLQDPDDLFISDDRKGFSGPIPVLLRLTIEEFNYTEASRKTTLRRELSI
jgi:hypothetical protein